VPERRAGIVVLINLEEAKPPIWPRTDEDCAGNAFAIQEIEVSKKARQSGAIVLGMRASRPESRSALVGHDHESITWMTPLD